MRFAEVLFPPRSIWAVDDQIRPDKGDRRSPLGQRRIIILIHGYNNDKVKAEESYALFKEKLLDRLGRVGTSGRLDSIWGFFWPAYIEGLVHGLRRHVMQRLRRERLPTTDSALLPLASALSYSLQVKKAREVGAELGRYLLALCDDALACEVVFVAHSLGCRVALEAAQVIANEGGTWQRKPLRAMCMMAAAVPVHMVEKGAGLAASARAAQRTYVLYSRRDHILRRWFRPGQALAGEGYRSEAVGLHGDPRIWSSSDETMLEHGDYWASPVTTPHLGRLFGLEARREELPGFDVLEWPGTVARELPNSVLPDLRR